MSKVETPDIPKVPRPPDDRQSADAHRLLLVSLFLGTTVLGMPFLGMVLYYDKTGQGGLTILTCVLVAGAGGGFVSGLRRLYAFEDIYPNQEYRGMFRQMSLYAMAFSLVPAIVGSIGAVVLYLVFAAGLLKGDLFPEFACLNAAASCGAFHDFVSSWAPANATANAKAIVWGFVAGFSERFVPDVLNRLGSRESKAPP